MKGFGDGFWGWIGERGAVMGEERVRAKVGRGDGQALSSSSSDDDSCCSLGAAAGEGMTR